MEWLRKYLNEGILVIFGDFWDGILLALPHSSSEPSRGPLHGKVKAAHRSRITISKLSRYPGGLAVSAGLNR